MVIRFTQNLRNKSFIILVKENKTLPFNSRRTHANKGTSGLRTPKKGGRASEKSETGEIWIEEMIRRRFPPSIARLECRVLQLHSCGRASIFFFILLSTGYSPFEILGLDAVPMQKIREILLMTKKELKCSKGSSPSLILEVD